MALIMELDLDWARAGYLRLPDGKLKAVRGIELLAADALRLQTTVFWSLDIPDGKLGYSNRECRGVLLDPRLFLSYPYAFREVFGEELGHIAAGSSDDQARQWAIRRYGELIVQPEWLAA